MVNIIKPFWVGNLDFALAETTKKEQFNTSNSKCLLKTVHNTKNDLPNMTPAAINYKQGLGKQDLLILSLNYIKVALTGIK